MEPIDRNHRKREKPIAVYKRDGSYLSHCTKKRAAQMINRQKAEWTGYNQICLLITSQDEKRYRQQVLARDQYRCYICDIQLTEDNYTIDHRTPRSRGGSDLPENMACCCPTCNEEKDDRTYEEYYISLGAYVLYMMCYYRLIRR